MTKRKLAAFSILCLAASQAMLLSGCSGKVFPSVEKQLKQERKDSLVDTSPVGKPFPLGNCTAQAHDVTFSSGYPSKITVVTADCPTSTTQTEISSEKHAAPAAIVTPKFKP